MSGVIHALVESDPVALSVAVSPKALRAVWKVTKMSKLVKARN